MEKRKRKGKEKKNKGKEKQKKQKEMPSGFNSSAIVVFSKGKNLQSSFPGMGIHCGENCSRSDSGGELTAERSTLVLRHGRDETRT